MNRLIPVIAALVLLSGALLVTLKTKMETIENVQQQYDLLQCEYDSIQDELDEIEHNEFDRVYKRFKLYNKNIDTLTVNHFIKVVKL